MPRNTTVTCSGGAWTQITDADVTNITFQNLSQTRYMQVKATSGSAPTDLTGAALYPPVNGEINVLLSELFPGVTGGVRVFVYAPLTVEVYVSHA